MAFSLFLTFLLQFALKVCFFSYLFRNTGGAPSEFQLKSFFFSGRALHSFHYSFLNGCILFFFFFSSRICPDFALSLNACSFNTTPLLRLCFMRCDSEVWLARRRAGLERKASHSGRSAAGVREDLNSLHPPPPFPTIQSPRIQELPLFC